MPAVASPQLNKNISIIKQRNSSLISVFTFNSWFHVFFYISVYSGGKQRWQHCSETRPAVQQQQRYVSDVARVCRGNRDRSWFDCLKNAVLVSKYIKDIWLVKNGFNMYFSNNGVIICSFLPFAWIDSGPGASLLKGISSGKTHTDTGNSSTVRCLLSDVSAQLYSRDKG